MQTSPKYADTETRGEYELVKRDYIKGMYACDGERVPTVLNDPIEAYLAAMRPYLEELRMLFTQGSLTGIETEAKFEPGAGWMVEIKPVINTKVRKAWARR